jgi:hypothetical protein
MSLIPMGITGYPLSVLVLGPIISVEAGELSAGLLMAIPLRLVGIRLIPERVAQFPRVTDRR